MRQQLAVLVPNRGDFIRAVSVAKPGPRGWLLLALLLLVVLVCYAPTLGAPFVWDDSRLVLDSPEIRSLDLGHAFSKPFWFGAPGEAGSSAFFRPLTSLSFGVDYRLHGDNPAGYHLSNLVFHLLGTSALFVLLRRRGLGALVAVALAAWWALLPRLTEGVAWISGRGDVLAGLFALGALLAFRPNDAVRLVLAGFLALCSVFSKESGIATFAALGGLYWAAGRDGSSRVSRNTAALALGLPLALYVALRLNAGASAGDALPLPKSQRVYAALEALGRYTSMLVDAFRPRTFMGRLGQPDWWFVALGAATLLLLVGLLPRLRRAAPETLPYVALLLLPLALVVHVIPLPVTVVASDRYLYLPTLGLVLSVAKTFDAGVVAKPWLLALPLALAVMGATEVVSRVGDYTDEAAFWMAAARGAPREATPIVELGTQAYEAGCYAEAARLYERALLLHDRSSPRGLENAALIASMTGDRTRAAQLGERLLRRFPRVASLELRRAGLALAALEFDTARAHANRALALRPHFRQASGFLRMLDEVQRVWLDVESGAAPAEARLGVEMRALRYPEAVSTLQQLLVQPTTDERVSREGVLFVLRVGRIEDASAVLALYRQHYPAVDATPFVNALQDRVAAAANLRRRLRDLPAAAD